MPEFFDVIMKYVVVPILGWNWMLHKQQNQHRTDLKVLETQLTAALAAQSASEARLEKRLDAMMAKLDSIEAALRK